MQESHYKKFKGKLVTRTEADGETIIAVADTCQELARTLGVTDSAVSHGLSRGSRLYHLIDIAEVD